MFATTLLFVGLAALNGDGVAAHGAPSTPSDLRAGQVTAHSITLTWTSPFVGSSQPKFSIMYKRADENWPDYDQITNIGDLGHESTIRYTITDLFPNTWYVFRVRTSNQYSGNSNSAHTSSLPVKTLGEDEVVPYIGAEENLTAIMETAFAYCPRPGNCAGHIIRIDTAVDLAECQAKCDQLCKCKGVQFQDTSCELKHYVCRDNELTEMGQGNYYIKRGQAETCENIHQRNTCNGQAFAYCHRPKKDCCGRDLRTLYGVAGPEVCQAACDQDCECKSFQFHDNKCWLKRAVCTDAQLGDSDEGNDYVRRGSCDKCP